MKKKLLIAASGVMLCISFFLVNRAKAQDEQPSKRKEEYCEIVGTTQLFSTKLVISIDYGQERKWFQDNRAKDAEGNVKKFNSMIDAINYMTEEGWTFVNAFPVTMGNTNVYHYMMKRVIVPKE